MNFMTSLGVTMEMDYHGSFLSNFGSTGAYLVRTIHIWSNLQSIDAPLLVCGEFVYAILIKFHA